MERGLGLGTAKTAYRKFETNIPRHETARPQSQFLHLFSVSYLYIPTVDLPILLQENMWEYTVSIAHRNMNIEGAQILDWEYIN